METELLKYSGIAGAVIIGFIAVFKLFIGHLDKRETAFIEQINQSDTRHCEAYEKLNATIDKNTEFTQKAINASQETLTYLKIRNGSDRQIIS